MHGFEHMAGGFGDGRHAPGDVEAAPRFPCTEIAITNLSNAETVNRLSTTNPPKYLRYLRVQLVNIYGSIR
jgi:hypothetical protein